MIHHHLVKSGDTLTAIARDLNSTVAAIQRANGLADPNRIFPGDVLHVPVVVAEEPPAEEPPAEEPPAEEPPAEEPPAEEPPAEEPPAPRDGYLWADVSHLPMEGPAWGDVAATALGSWGNADIQDQDSNHDVRVLAGAMYAARTGDETVRQRVEDAIHAAIETENGGRSLALSRNLTAYVLAADFIGLPADGPFGVWLRDVRSEVLSSRSLISTHEDRPNNWGTHAGTARIAAALFLDDTEDLERAVQVFRGFLGDRSQYAGFTYGSDLSWQADPANPVGINPSGATISGGRVGGVIPDDQRRTGSFTWPAPRGSYPWEAMQGIVATATLLARNGYPDVWKWSNDAVWRAALWLYYTNDNPPSGDDLFIVPLLRAVYPASFPAVSSPVGHGKAIGWTDWTHGS